MKARLSILFVLLFVLTSALAAEKPTTTLMLEKGMAGTAIRQLFGQPDKVEDLKSSEIKAEKWIYRRQVTEGAYQTANTQTAVPAMVFGGDRGMKVGQAIVPEYRLKFYRVYQVTALLMVDGKLECGRREESFAN